MRMGGIVRDHKWSVILALLWLIRFATLNGAPWQNSPLWMEWFDQSRYFLSAKAFARGDLTPAAHWYPLAYPLIAAPFVWFVPADPFLPLDLALYLVAAHAFLRVAGRFAIAPWAAVLCFVLTTLTDAPVARGWVDPWTTTLSAALIWLLADRSLLLIDDRDARPKVLSLAAFGALTAAIPLVRPVDAIISAICIAVVAIVYGRRGVLTARSIAIVFVSGAALVGLYAGLHLAIYGPRATPYMIAAARTGFIWLDIGWKTYVLLIHAEPWFPETQAIVERMPWLPFGCAGLVAMAIGGDARTRGTIALLLLMAVPVSLVMLAYADLQPPGLWRFGNIHYFKWALPLFGLGVMLLIRQLRAPRGGRMRLALVTLACLLPLTVRIVPRPVADATPARMLTFAGDTNRAWEEAYFAPVTIIDAAGRTANINDFHQVPDADGQRAIAVSRKFEAGARRRDPGETRYPQPQTPSGRFAERLTIIGR